MQYKTITITPTTKSFDFDIDNFSNCSIHRVTKIIKNNATITITFSDDIEAIADLLIVSDLYLDNDGVTVYVLWDDKLWEAKFNSVIHALSAAFGGKEGKEKARRLAAKAKAYQAAKASSRVRKTKEDTSTGKGNQP